MAIFDTSGPLVQRGGNDYALLPSFPLAYAWCISLGTFVWSQPPRLRAETATPDELTRRSLFRLGWRLVKRVRAGVSALDAVRLHLPAPALFLRL
jgi:hypothetical protein